jgi:hypothetical protein
MRTSTMGIFSSPFLVAVLLLQQPYGGAANAAWEKMGQRILKKAKNTKIGKKQKSSAPSSEPSSEPSSAPSSAPFSAPSSEPSSESECKLVSEIQIFVGAQQVTTVAAELLEQVVIRSDRVDEVIPSEPGVSILLDFSPLGVTEEFGIEIYADIFGLTNSVECSANDFGGQPVVKKDTFKCSDLTGSSTQTFCFTDPRLPPAGGDPNSVLTCTAYAVSFGFDVGAVICYTVVYNKNNCCEVSRN